MNSNTLTDDQIGDVLMVGYGYHRQMDHLTERCVWVKGWLPGAPTNPLNDEPIADDSDVAPEMKHCIEVVTAPYSLGQPRRYYTADYPVGAHVDDSGTTYQVRDVNGVMMFVARTDLNF